jgi:alpha-galactosidase
MYYAFFADHWNGEVELRGLKTGSHRVRDYFNDRDLGSVSGAHHRLPATFERFLLLEVISA